MILTEAAIDEFVRTTDALGGPGSVECDRYWADFSYAPTYVVDQSLDPFSEAYVEQQLTLYREISGRELDQVVNELAPIDIERNVAAANPYDHPDPLILADHIVRLTKAFRASGAARGAHLLDMGCGWGLSSEVAAYLGYRVTAVDINPDFVSLVNRRAQRFGWPITAVQSEFDTYRPEPNTDLVLFYECLHHAVRPWTLVKTMADSLTPVTGRLLLAGEPINDYWWTNWGLRLDAMSVYCIRKFGWFESGWSQPFLEECFRRAGLGMTTQYDEYGATVVGQRTLLATHSATAYISATWSSGLLAEGDVMLTVGAGSFDVAFPKGATGAYLKVLCYRPQGLHLEINSGRQAIFSGDVPAEFTDILIQRRADRMRIDIACDTWTPAVDIGNGDERTLGIHLHSIAFY